MIHPLTLLAQVTQRANCSEAEQAGGGAAKCVSTLPEIKANEAQIQNLLSIVFGVFAAVAVIVIILAAINLAAAEGNPEGISKAKKTIIYALIGLIISLSAEALVLTVLGRF